MKFTIIAGEKSGDKQGALVIKELLLRQPELQITGLGGEQMHALAPAIENWSEEAAVIGIVEVLKKFSFFKSKLDAMTEHIVAEQPDVLLLIDYPGFNQRLAERVHRLCPKTMIAWFIAPMVWAWHKGRLPKLAATLDLMLCTFPFEKELFLKAGLDTEFVGHPLVDDIKAMRHEEAREQELIGLFPGSRLREVERIFPVMLETVKLLQTQQPSWRFVTSASSPKMEQIMRRLAQEAGVDAATLNISTEGYHGLMERASAALVTSGTATLEAALHALPFALVYRVPALTYWMARAVLKIKYLGMVNLLVDKPVVREMIQHDFNPADAVAELQALMTEPYRSELAAGMAESVATLGPGGAAARAAEAILDRLAAREQG